MEHHSPERRIGTNGTEVNKTPYASLQTSFNDVLSPFHIRQSDLARSIPYNRDGGCKMKDNFISFYCLEKTQVIEDISCDNFDSQSFNTPAVISDQNPHSPILLDQRPNEIGAHGTIQ